MNLFKRIYIWCKRFRYRKGYGVHSPFAFNLITNVIYEKMPYYAYHDLQSVCESTNPALPRYSRRVNKLLFRLANRFRPDYIMDVGTGAGISLCYLAAGCFNARCVTLCGEVTDDSVVDIVDRCKNATLLSGKEIEVVHEELQLNPRIGLLHLAYTSYYREVFEMCLSHVDDETIFIVEGIYDNAEKQMWWQSVVADERTGITFDLYELGIICFDKRKNKQHYVINF